VQRKSGRDSGLYTLALACTRGREAIVENFRALLHERDLTEQQWRVLRALHEHGAMDTPQLCETCCIHKVSMMRILRTLVERRLVKRSVDRNDQRRHVVAIASAGERIAQDMMPRTRAIYDAILSRLGREKARQLARLLEELAASAAPASAQASSSTLSRNLRKR